MGSDLRLCSGAEATRKFKKAGWTKTRQKGSHVMLTKPGYEYTLSVPQHKELGPGLLRKLIKQAGFTVEEFNKL
ncbi:MAG: type II toxin-antitoxin system HicA family toxin [Deltaproteobacteria bacterium]|nr:type II toxin-antitoxin system HicA family toxin [Deltaproteobacteria bacterium]